MGQDALRKKITNCILTLNLAVRHVPSIAVAFVALSKLKLVSTLTNRFPDGNGQPNELYKGPKLVWNTQSK